MTTSFPKRRSTPGTSVRFFRRWLPSLLLGFLSLSFQIILLREFTAHFYGSELSIGILLACWLLWGGLGSIAAYRIRYSLRRFIHVNFLLLFMFPLCLTLLRSSGIILGILPGETIGMGPTMLFALPLTFVIGFPLGILFVFNTRFLGASVPRVYLLESLGAAAGGLFVYFILIPHFSNWQSASLIGAASACALLISFPNRRSIPTASAALLVLAAFFLADFPIQKAVWKPFHLIHAEDSQYGKIQVIESDGQYTIYDNHLRLFTFPDIEAAEESVHFTLSRNTAADNVLIIGGGGECLREALKYPECAIDYVELDPRIIDVTRSLLPPDAHASFSDKRVHVFNRDGRRFLTSADKPYDVIILNLPDPATAQINRFYTLEFFKEVRDKLSGSGVFSFRVGSAENYISPQLQSFLSSLYYTLHEVFSSVVVVPGANNIFLASRHQLSLDLEDFTSPLKELSLDTIYFTPSILEARLGPLRVETLRRTIIAGDKTINRDMTPISYLFSTQVWSTQFSGFETHILARLSKIPRFWLLDFPLILFVLVLSLLYFRRRETSLSLVPIAVMGLTSLVFEIVLIVAFQAFWGYIYHEFALLFSSFMFGLGIGAYIALKIRKHSASTIAVCQAAIILILVFCLSILSRQPAPWIIFLSLSLMGVTCGSLFVFSNRLYLRLKRNLGIGYGLDLLGSFFGALFASSLLIPLVGLHRLLLYLLLLNSFSLLYTLGWLRRPPNQLYHS